MAKSKDIREVAQLQDDLKHEAGKWAQLGWFEKEGPKADQAAKFVEASLKHYVVSYLRLLLAMFAGVKTC